MKTPTNGIRAVPIILAFALRWISSRSFNVREFWHLLICASVYLASVGDWPVGPTDPHPVRMIADAVASEHVLTYVFKVLPPFIGRSVQHGFGIFASQFTAQFSRNVIAG